MDIDTAIKIVKEYGKILEEDPIKNIQGRLLSTLPYDKDTVKEAIKVDLTYVGTTEPRDEKLFRSLQLSFLQLASFVPDKSVIPFNLNAALDSNEVCHKYQKYLIECEKINKNIMEQTSQLVAELDAFCQDNGL